MNVSLQFHIPTLREALSLWKAGLLLAVLALTLVWPDARPALASSNSIESPDTAGSVGSETSLQIDASGNPVVSYEDFSNGDLKVLHCDDPNCAGDESANTNSPDTGGNVGRSTSLQLDASGNPVVSYQDITNSDLKLLHCDDPYCAGDESANIESPDTTGSIAVLGTSLQLDSSGNPVVSYLDLTNQSLKVLHCDDPNCAGDESANTNSPDTSPGIVGVLSSLELDAAGYPVVSYIDLTNGDLKVLHCDDPYCAGDESANIESPDTASDVTLGTSLELDASGHPVVSYYDDAGGDLKVLHCDDPNCAGDENANIASPDTTGDVGEQSSLQLDSLGNPVIAYRDITNSDLKLLHCDDPNCAGDESANTKSPDTTGIVGEYTSLQLDAAGNPVVSYRDFTNQDLKLLHCFLPNCDVGSSSIFLENTVTYALPKTCSDVRNAADVFLFSVCDNDFQGAPDTDSVCDDGTDLICNDEDPREGTILLTLVAGTYHFETGKAPLNHTPEKSIRACTVDSNSKCPVQFTYSTAAKPWYPWDINADGVVDLPNDILGVILHFCPVISDPCAKP